MSKQENRKDGTALEESFDALEQAMPQSGGDMGDTMAFTPLGKQAEKQQPAQAAGRKEAGGPGPRAPGNTAEAPPRKAKASGTRVLGRLCIVLAISFAVLATASMVLSHLFDPAKFVAEATQALAGGDIKALEQLVQPAEGLTADEASLTALCDAFCRAVCARGAGPAAAGTGNGRDPCRQCIPGAGCGKGQCVSGLCKV